MTCYIIIYEINPNYSYVNLINAIKSYPNWGKITNTSWAIVCDQSAEEIRNYLMQNMNNSDKIMFIRSGSEAAWNNALADTEWLKNNLIII